MNARMSALSRCTLIIVVAGSLAAWAPAANADSRETAPPNLDRSLSKMPTNGHSPDGVPGEAQAQPQKRPTSNGISYHGGPVLYKGVHVYLIWYGNWSGDSGTTILPTLVRGFSGSPYYNINTTYTDGANRQVPNAVTLTGQTTDAYSQGATNLSDTSINTIVASAISSGRLPSDTDGLYFVLTSADVTKTGFLTSYCGWHTSAIISGADIKYSFVGNPGTNAACLAQTAGSPNSNVGVDGMASVLAHELEEAATDPDLNAWYDTRGYENADKCAWTFGTTYTTANGSKANMTLGGLNFLIQRNWVNAAGGYCALSY